MLLVIGAEYHEECVGNDATLFLVVAGAIMICMSLATLVAHLAKVCIPYKITGSYRQCYHFWLMLAMFWLLGQINVGHNHLRNGHNSSQHCQNQPW